MRIQQSEWQELYQTEAIEGLPWYSRDLDDDFASILISSTSGQSVWDLGCGPGTQAVHLAQAGYTVTATDLAPDAIAYAKDLARSKDAEVDFQVDDITNSIVDGTFDFVIDRGCFHTIPPELHTKYVATVTERLKQNGQLLLKTFHIDETGDGGPRRYDEATIKEVFADHFDVVEFRMTHFIGNRIPYPIALFSVLRKR